MDEGGYRVAERASLRGCGALAKVGNALLNRDAFRPSRFSEFR